LSVRKLVDVVAGIPKQLSFHFYDFSTMLYNVYKFTGFENKLETKALQLGSWN
jgi:hypothetical protein